MLIDRFISTVCMVIRIAILEVYKLTLSNKAVLNCDLIEVRKNNWFKSQKFKNHRSCLSGILF